MTELCLFIHKSTNEEKKKENKEKQNKFFKKMCMYKTTLGDHQTRTMLVCDWHTDTGRPASYLAMNRKSDRLQVEKTAMQTQSSTDVHNVNTVTSRRSRMDRCMFVVGRWGLHKDM